ncbi:MAG: hypothetical protein ACK528_06475 [Alphaproteobacteria bacterium]|jgi:hypothetical protein
MMAKTVAEQRIKELQKQVHGLRERVYDLEAAAENQTRRHEAEIRKLKEQAELEDTRQLRRETELVAQRHMAIELLARIEREM